MFIEYNIAEYYIIYRNLREMGELSILTIIVSLAVCSLLVYGIFQYMKVRLTVLEQSHREQAMILQQYIEESSSDIHRLYKMSSAHYNGSDGSLPQGSIILEYANEKQSLDEKPVAYHEPHTIHLDTAFFQNKRSNNLIEISSDSENTTESESESESDDSSSESSSADQSDAESESESESENENDNDNDNDDTHKRVDTNTTNEHHIESIEIHESEVKTITVDLGTLHDQEANKKSDVSPKPIDVLSLLYKNAQVNPLPEDNDLEDVVASVIETSTEQEVSAEPAAPAAPVNVPLSAMSVPDLKHLLKELCKNQPEKHAEIQRLKKSELIYAIKQLQQ